MYRRYEIIFYCYIILIGHAKFSHAYKEDEDADVKTCEPDCDSKIYCSGELLHDVQTLRVFGEGSGTTFVEKRLLFSEDEIVRKYKQLKEKTAGGKTPSVQVVRQFVDENMANDSLSTCDFPDFTNNPTILKKTNKDKYKKWLTHLNKLWTELGSIIHEDVKKNPDRHSYLYVPNRFIKAGGRFTGTYYWDSFWIVRGLLLCDMHETARGIIENIVVLVRKYKHMPNGNRIYYIKRSQPPMLIQTASTYYQHTNNFTFIQTNIKAFEEEFNWWVQHRSVNVEKEGKVYLMFRYKSVSCTPRPESYAEDYELVKNITDEKRKMKIFTGIRSAAESGWDFSSRHIRGAGNSNGGTLRQMDSQNLIYVDINSIIQSNAKILQQWHQKLANKTAVAYYKKFAENLLDAIEKVLWNDKAGVWQDYDLISDTHRDYFYISNLTPLWSNSFTNKGHVDKVIKYLKDQRIIGSDLSAKYYCVPTSNDNSTQQWDFPNCWAPLQAFLIHGLQQNSDTNSDAGKVAFNLAQMWIKTTYEGYRNATVMYEKYSAIDFGSTGAGGEYEPQTGFGWTNGFTMDIFDTWANKLE